MFVIDSHVLDGADDVLADPARNIPARLGSWPKFQADRRHPDAALAGFRLLIRSSMARNKCRGKATSAIWNTTYRAALMLAELVGFDVMDG